MSRIIRSLSNVLALVIVMLVVNVTVLEGQTYHVLYSFGTNAGDPKNPQTNGLMSQGRDGNLYSTTSVGGSFNLGAAFFFTPTGTLTKLSDFKNSPLGGLNLALTATCTAPNQRAEQRARVRSSRLRLLAS